MKSLVAFCLLLFISRSLSKQIKDDVPRQQNLDLDNLPLNSVVEVGDTIVLTCGVADPDTEHSLQWFEFAYSQTGALISDNGVVLGHPEAARYHIITDPRGRYDLQISDVKLSDGGTYMCRDSRTNPPNKMQHSAQLTVGGPTANCTSTVGANGIVLEHAYHSNDCILDYKGGLIPNVSWSGLGGFNSAYVATDSQVWGGMHFNVTRNMEGRSYNALLYFSGYFLPVDGNSANNVPDYQISHEGVVMRVRWGPGNVHATPIKPFYEPGDQIQCIADANPNATINWANMDELDVIPGDTIEVGTSWRGRNTTLRCEAKNEIEGITYSVNIFVYAYVPPLTEPTTTTTAPTTTTPPAVSDCGDLTGEWESTQPTRGYLCIRLNLQSNGLLTGVMANDSDTYWIDIVGRAKATNYDQVGFNGIWPFDVGVSSFVGECHRCVGVEQLLVNVISRAVSETCGVKGETRYSSQYLFRRSTTQRCAWAASAAQLNQLAKKA